MIHRLTAIGLIEPEIKEPNILFSYETVLRVKCIFRLRKDLGVNLSSAGIILDLLDQIDSLKQEVKRLRKLLKTL